MQILLDTAEGCNAAAHRCHPLTISSPMGNQMWPACHVCLFRPWWTADKWTRIADTDTNLSPLCCSLFAFFFEKPFGDWRWNQTVTRLVFFCESEGAKDAHVSLLPQLKRCPRPSGKWYNEDLYAYTLPHFNCKRCTHPALWTGDGCIMGRAQNMTVHHVRAMVPLLFSLLSPAVFILRGLFRFTVLARAALWKFEINVSAVGDETTCKRRAHSIIAKQLTTLTNANLVVRVFTRGKPAYEKKKMLRYFWFNWISEAPPVRPNAAISANKVSEWVTRRAKGQPTFEASNGAKLPIYTHWPNLLALILTNA